MLPLPELCGFIEDMSDVFNFSPAVFLSEIQTHNHNNVVFWNFP